MMDASFIKAIADMAKPATVEIGGRTYAMGHLLPVTDTEPDPLAFSSLAGLKAYMQAEKFDQNYLLTALQAGRLAFHVSDFDEVRLISEIHGEFSHRVVLAVSTSSGSCDFPFGNFIDQENFVIKVQAQFVQSEFRDSLLQLVGTARGEEVTTEEDTGVIQTVTAKSGRLLGKVDLPNPVLLAPRRIFPELPQPVSPFILRARKQGDGMAFALFEADGGAWKVAALGSIRTYLEEFKLGIPILG